jgi:hypothetical protein
VFNTFLKRLPAVVFLSLVFAPALFGQTAGSVSGHVSDPTKALISGAKIALNNLATGAERTTVSTAAGDYTFTEVPVGVYNITATYTGFKTSSTPNVEVQVQQSVRVDFTLQVGAVSQTVEVEASGALLQADNATLGTVISNEAITEQPLNGRNYLGLVALASNVNTLSSSSGQAGSRLGGDRASQSISVGGQRIMFDYYTLDGVSNTDPDFNTYIGLPSIDGIQEFKVQTGVYPAEFGHEASQVNVVSKNGTNTLHGSGYEFIRNNYVDALPYWFPERHPVGTLETVTPFKYNDFGFEFDGPVWIPKVYNGRNKFFFMVDNEWYHSRADNPNATAVVPTVAMAAGNFQGYNYQTIDSSGVVHTVPVTLYDPTTGNAQGQAKTPFANNQIPVTPQSTALLKYLGTAPAAPTYLCPAAPKPNPTTGAVTYSSCSPIANYKYTTLNPTDRQSLTVRGDYNLSDKSQFSFRYSAGNENILSTGLLGAGSKIITQYYQYMGSYTRTISPSVVNEARFGYSHFFNSLGLLSAYTNDVVDAVKIPGLGGGDPSTWGIPAQTFGSGPNTGGLTGTTPNTWTTGIGDAGGDGPYVLHDPTWQIVDNLSWAKGKNDFRFGFEYNRQTFNQLGNQFSRGLFSTEPLATAQNTAGTLSGGDSLADFELGHLYQSQVAVAVANANYVRNVEAAYAEDTYKLLPNLTIAAGLRYELTPPWNDTLGNEFNTVVPVLPKLGDTHTTYATSQYPTLTRQGNCSAANVYQGVNVVFTTNGPPVTCSNGTIPAGPLLDTRYLNFAPRLGISYSPNSRLVIRTGFGIFYNQDIGNAYFDLARNIAGRVSYTNQDSAAPYPTSNLTWNNATPASGGGSSVVTLPLNTTIYANAVSHHTSYTEQYLLNIQQQVGKNWSFEMGFQGALSRHLYGFLNANQATPYGYLGTGATSVVSRTPFNATATSNEGIQYVHDEGTANYNAGSFKATRKFSHGFNLIASYTLAKSLDDSSGVRNQGNDNLYPQNSDCIPCEYGPSAFDVRNRVVVSGLYELPIGPDKLLRVNNKLMYALIGGWQAGGVFTHQTGAIATPLYGTDNSSIASPFGNFDRPNATGISPYVTGSARSVDNWVNKAAYAQPTPGFFGNATRGSFVGPGFTNLDASLHKDFHMPYNEKHKLSIRFEAFNALNHPNYSIATLTYTSSSLGQVNAGGMRVLQLAAKYTF